MNNISNEPNWSSSSGRIELYIPEQAIDECYHSGECYYDCKTWVDEIDFTGIERRTIEQELQCFGCWDDLETVDLRELKIRLIWIASADISENKFINKRAKGTSWKT